MLEAWSHWYLSWVEHLWDHQVLVPPAFGGPLCSSWQLVAWSVCAVVANYVGSHYWCINALAHGQEPILLPPSHLHPWALAGALSRGDSDAHHLWLTSSMEAGSEQASPWIASLANEQLHQEHKLNPPSLKSNMPEDVWVILEALSCLEGFIQSVGWCQQKKY